MDELQIIIHSQRELLRKLDLILDLLSVSIEGGEFVMQELEDLKTEVAADTAIEASAVKLIQGLAAQIAKNVTDPQALTALAESLHASAADLAKAVAANTPVEPPAPPVAPTV